MTKRKNLDFQEGDEEERGEKGRKKERRGRRRTLKLTKTIHFLPFYFVILFYVI